jgi:hypothetical protein
MNSTFKKHPINQRIRLWVLVASDREYNDSGVWMLQYLNKEDVNTL